MTPDAFKAWRKSLGLKQKDAADRLGLKKRVIQYYEKGARGGKDIEIPKTVELACFALSMGVASYDGRTVPDGAHDAELTLRVAGSKPGSITTRR
ncbi:XRE family transcriptional regulator [Fulvimarina endophytica]|uniref:XRE family transcriptional regulator n=1 Tax=Fulvimarina endophytica TaxID=2293836 RepID=A0A371WZK5_9HYPH|nr:helix-turn-helix transcriptional regulator [Fulvimarina endophytica]RFC62392.1 XRE family transcriptional regulator [Fulvimarina endophytica]